MWFHELDLEQREDSNRKTTESKPKLRCQKERRKRIE
jgi:hypothetical protein